MSKATITLIEHLARGAKPGTDTSCGAILAGLISPAAQPQIKAEAEKANVRSLRTEGGTWKVASLAGTPLN
jgi:hypothetical protein